MQEEVPSGGRLFVRMAHEWEPECVLPRCAEDRRSMPNPQREVELELAGLKRRGFRRMVDHELAQSPSGAGDFLAAISG